MGVFTAPDKQVGLTEAAQIVTDGAVVALGGALSYRQPMALARELIRQGRSGLHVVGSAHGIDVDLLVAAGAVGIVEESYVGYEQDFGLAPAYRRAAESGAVTLRESCCYTLLQQLRAAEYGIPFMPVRGIVGSGILGLHPEYAEITSPFGGERLVAVPALAPDVALVHAPLADRRGNVHLTRPLVLDERFAFASRAVVVTAERVGETGEVSAAGIVIPAFAVTAVVEAPYGAHPTSCYPAYTYDRAHLGAWVEAAADEAGAKAYLDRYVGDSEQDYQAAVGEQRFCELGEWSQSDERWMELLS
jgi:glutaconate CoA-transferase, subunit A